MPEYGNVFADGDFVAFAERFNDGQRFRCRDRNIALSTLGCLIGNYVTGFYLIPTLTINKLVLASAGALSFTAA